MMEWTDRHFRYLVRLMSKHTRLYTEMVTSSALYYGERKRFLQFNSVEHPIALQLGGNDPAEMAQAAKWGAKYGYDEININVGCPSDRVQSGRFGVCLMREPTQVAKCIHAMQQETELPISVKCRIGVDEDDSYSFLNNFVHTAAEAGCRIFIIHARKAWLNGLSPKQNREIPKLDYSRVYQLKKDHPTLQIIINGGIDSVADINHHLTQVDGVMIGRQAYKHPKFLMQIDQEIFNDSKKSLKTMDDIVIKYADYIKNNMKTGVPLKCMSKHMLNLYQNIPGAKQWRRHLSENMHKPGVGVELIYEGLEIINKKCA